MKKVLIISYHSLPLDVIASYRAMAYLKHLKKFGIDPTLLTHHWDDNKSREISHEYFDYGTIIRIPIKNHRINSLITWIEHIPIINKVSILIRWLRGQLDSTAQDWNSYASLRSFCFDFLKSQQFDVLIGIFSPHHHLRLCYEINKKFQIPYVLDFRDLWSNRIINKNYSPNATDKIQDYLTRFYWRKWLKSALLFSITSEDWMRRLTILTKTKSLVIKNGYDEDFFNNLDGQSSNEQFIILHSGSLYQHQKLDIFLRGCKLFITAKNPDRFKVKFIGATRSVSSSRLSGYLYRAQQIIEGYIPPNYFEITPRISKSELQLHFSESHILLFPSFPDSPGTYGGKIYDYIAAKKNILVVPDDKNVVSELVLETKSGTIANTPEEVYDYLIKSYKKWKEVGKIKYFGDQKAISQYSRQNQVGKMARGINQYLL